MKLKKLDYGFYRVCIIKGKGTEMDWRSIDGTHL